MRAVRKYIINDIGYSVHELAELAGCNFQAMKGRLRSMTPEKTVAGGKVIPRTGLKGNAPRPKRKATPEKAAELGKKLDTRKVIIPKDVKRTTADDKWKPAGLPVGYQSQLSATECRPWADAAAYNFNHAASAAQQGE